MEFVAHIRDDKAEEQTVKEHLENTAFLAAKYSKKLSLNNICELQGLLHDAGKLNKDFNSYIHNNSSFKRGEIDHSFAGARYIFELGCKSEDAYLKEASRLIAHTIISHHGLHDWVKEDGNNYFSERISENNRYSESINNLNDIYSENYFISKLKEASKEYQNKINEIKAISRNKTDITFYLGFFERLLQSYVIDADRTDTSSFMSGSSTERTYDIKALWNNMKVKIEEKLLSFSENKDKISLQRMSISDRCKDFASHKTGVCRLIVPTGGGKTFSSLRFAVEYCINHKMDRIFYIAPFMSILEQNSDVIRSIAGDDAFLEHHSNIIQGIENDEELSEYELLCDKWEAPVIATTMVQFLNTLFLSKSTSVRRMHQLCNSVIIIDEVQSVPLKCVNLFNLAINFLTKICGSTVVMCSATQPVFDKTEFPLIYDDRNDMIENYNEDFEVFKRTEVISALQPSGYSYKKAAEFCFEKYEENGNLLVVVNTKAAAAEIFKEIRIMSDDDVAVLHLSTNMCPQHRKDIIKTMQKALKNKEKIICVTTQLIEAGVDISFNCVVRSLAGMDNAAQAAGRCNRNGENNRICPVYVINISDENLKHLQEIKNSQDVSRQIIDCERFTDLVAPDTMSAYFSKIFSNEKNSMNYNVPNKKVTILELLSTDHQRWVIQKDKDIICTAQAFKSAGDFFEVIGNHTIDVLVPYNEDAVDKILYLNEQHTPEEYLKVTRTSQKYSVSVCTGMFKALEERGAVNTLKSGAKELKKEFFDINLGICLDGGLMDLLLY